MGPNLCPGVSTLQGQLTRLSLHMDQSAQESRAELERRDRQMQAQKEEMGALQAQVRAALDGFLRDFKERSI